MMDFKPTIVSSSQRIPGVPPQASLFDCHGCLGGSNNETPNELTEIPRHQARNESDKKHLKPAEDFLAAEMNKLSFQEISKALDDVHCVGEDIHEDEDMIRRSLAEFDQQAKARRNRYFELAMTQDKAYIEDEDFCLKFLRANFFDVNRSVGQMMSFLQYKARYFGEDKLGRDIALSDLSQEDVDLMRSGILHQQKGRDRSGRVVLYILNHLVGLIKEDTMIRVTYYIFYNLLIPLPVVQTKGVVGVYYDTAKPGDNFMKLNFKSQVTINLFAASLPFRYSSMHLCLKSGKSNLKLNNSVIEVIMSAFPRYSRVRTKIHYGSNMELQYQLQSHGVPLKACPVDADGGIRDKVLSAWYVDHVASLGFSSHWLDGDAVKKTEASYADMVDSSKPIAAPVPVMIRSKDVLLGRGVVLQNHPGNIQFRNFLANYSDAYDKAPRLQRRSIATALAQMIQGHGVRFLQLQESKEWAESDAKAVEAKIGQLFRSMRKEKIQNKT